MWCSVSHCEIHIGLTVRHLWTPCFHSSSSPVADLPFQSLPTRQLQPPYQHPIGKSSICLLVFVSETNTSQLTLKHRTQGPGWCHFWRSTETLPRECGIWSQDGWVQREAVSYPLAVQALELSPRKPSNGKNQNSGTTHLQHFAQGAAEVTRGCVIFIPSAVGAGWATGCFLSQWARWLQI